MLLASVLSLVMVVNAPGDDYGLMAAGPDFGNGRLVNASCGAGETDRLNPSKPTFVIIHGLNPLHPLMHFTVGPRYAEALRARFGPAVNVAFWDWNAATTHGLSHWRVRRRAVGQGRLLADTLLAHRVDLSRLHLIGQSAGCVLVASTARHLASVHGRPVGRLTMIDPAWQEHALIFEELSAGTAAPRVEHLWVPGASGFGAPASYPNVWDYEVPGPSGWRGLVDFSKSDHLHAVAWHIRSLTG